MHVSTAVLPSIGQTPPISLSEQTGEALVEALLPSLLPRLQRVIDQRVRDITGIEPGAVPESGPPLFVRRDEAARAIGTTVGSLQQRITSAAAPVVNLSARLRAAGEGRRTVRFPQVWLEGGRLLAMIAGREVPPTERSQVKLEGWPQRMSCNQVGKALGCSGYLVERFMETGGLPFYMVGSRNRIAIREDVEQYCFELIREAELLWDATRRPLGRRAA